MILKLAKFSIILPVRNGGNLLQECIHSILGQKLSDFELLVLDNNSTDGSASWIESLKDSRVKIFPSKQDLSIEDNWARAKSIPKAEFMTLIGHDDLLYEDYLEVMNDLIRLHPDASLYQTHFSYINQHGKEIRKSKPVAESEGAAEFLEKLLRNEIDIMGTGFMIRSSDYERVGGIPAYPNLLFADFELWMKLTGLKYKATASKECFSFRIHQSTTTVSPDTKFQLAFRQFVHFLKELEEQDEHLKTIIVSNSAPFLLKYCKGLSHRLLRTPKDKRGGLTVKQFVSECNDYGSLLGLKHFQPGKLASIRMAILLDKYAWTRSLFLGFKKLYPKPILK